VTELKGIIEKVSGPLVVAGNMSGSKMYDVVRVGDKRLLGEIIELNEDRASIQVYEDTAGLGTGEGIEITGKPLSVELGPGLLGSIYDGIQRPLDKLMEMDGNYIDRGADVPSLDRHNKWVFVPAVKTGDTVAEGDILGTVPETELIAHRIMVPFRISGTVKEIREGEFSVTETVCIIESEEGSPFEITMMQQWPVRIPRRYKKKLFPEEILITGQRVIDSLFPVAKGGTACIPGPFGSGKTVVQHQLAKWCNADIIVYIGCGERGNEMTSVLQEFPELKDPNTGQPLMKRTVLIANTSNMPVAAREASVYTGITVAEYFRDMGYSVALMADSTSRWAEAMREISGSLEEMPGEEGYPAYLSSRVADFYERSGRVLCRGQNGREGNLTVIGAVSPAGGDLSDPVVQATLRVVKVFWSLEDKLAFARHFPAISWLRSYTLYENVMEKFYSENVSESFVANRKKLVYILEKEEELAEIVRLVGADSLGSPDRLMLKTAKIIREDFLHQNAFNETDTYTSPELQNLIVEAIIFCHDQVMEEVEAGRDFSEFEKLESDMIISRMKNDTGDVSEIRDSVMERIRKEIRGISPERNEGGGDDK